MSFQTGQASGSRHQHIKKFESRVLNRSCADFLFYDKVADYLLECCSAETKPNTLSVFSLLPLIFCNIFVRSGEWWSYLIAIIAILMHQIFDIANKKQAYRLSQFNLTTYYIDHLYDSISCVLIIDITGQLLQLENVTRLTIIFFFGMLPFFTHHLAMYTSGYLTFYNISPAVEGLLILKIFFGICIFLPDLPTLLIFQYAISHIMIALSSIWLVVFLLDDLRTISRTKKQIHTDHYGVDNFPLKNLFVIGIIGYIVMQITTIEQALLKDSLYFNLALWTFTLIYTFTISELVLSYAYEQKHRQFTLNILISLLWFAVFYSVCGLSGIQEQVEVQIGRIVLGLVFSGELIYFFYYNYSNLKYLNRIIKGDN